MQVKFYDPFSKQKRIRLLYFIILHPIIFHLPIYTPILLCHLPFALFSVFFVRLKRGNTKVEKKSCLTFLCQTSCLELQNPGYQRRHVCVGKEKTQSGETWYLSTINAWSNLCTDLPYTIRGCQMKVKG